MWSVREAMLESKTILHVVETLECFMLSIYREYYDIKIVVTRYLILTEGEIICKIHWASIFHNS